MPDLAMSSIRRVYESDDEHPVPHKALPEVHCANGVPGLEETSTTRRIMNRARDEKVFITLIIGILIFIGTQLMNTRDSAQQQPYVDKHQDFRIQQNENHLIKIDGKLDKILEKILR